MPFIEQSLAEGVNGRALKVAIGQYDFAVDGGVQGTIALMGQTAIPSGATIVGGFVDVQTQCTGVGASIACQVEAANDIVNAAAVSGAPWSTTGRKSVIPVFTGATTVKTSAARDISVVIAAATTTAGAFDVTLFWVDMGD